MLTIILYKQLQTNKTIDSLCAKKKKLPNSDVFVMVIMLKCHISHHPKIIFSKIKYFFKVKYKYGTKI